MINVGRNLRRLREQRGLTQDALAERLHVTRQAVSNWETGRNQPDLDTLEKAARALGSELEDLLGEGRPVYPRFQPKAAGWVIALGAAALFLLADELFIVPRLLELKGMTYRVWPYMFNGLAVLPACRAAAGMLLPAVFSLWRNLQPEGAGKTALRIAAVLLLTPAALTALCLLLRTGPGRSRFVALMLSDPTGMRYGVVCRTLPFLAGLCLYPGFVRLETTASEE